MQAVQLHQQARQVPVVEEASVYVVEALDRQVADTAGVALNIPAQQALVVAVSAEQRVAPVQQLAFVQLVVVVAVADTVLVVLPKIDQNSFAVPQFSFAGKSVAAARMQDFASDHYWDTVVLLADWAEHNCRSEAAGKLADRLVDCLGRHWQGLAVAAAYTAVFGSEVPPAASSEHSEPEEGVAAEAQGAARQPRVLGFAGHTPAEAVRLAQRPE